jgi:peptidoglycan hydrolase CwlO-like protein
MRAKNMKNAPEIVAEINQLTDALIMVRADRTNIKAALDDAQRTADGNPARVTELTQKWNDNFDEIKLRENTINARFVAVRDLLGDNEKFRAVLTSNVERLQELSAPIQSQIDALTRQASEMQFNPNASYRTGLTEILAKIDALNGKLAAYALAIATRQAFIDQIPKEEAAPA